MTNTTEIGNVAFKRRYIDTLVRTPTVYNFDFYILMLSNSNNSNCYKMQITSSHSKMQTKNAHMGNK